MICVTSYNGSMTTAVINVSNNEMIMKRSQNSYSGQLLLPTQPGLSPALTPPP